MIGAPGFEVVVNEFGGRMPVAYELFVFLASGGLAIPLMIGCWYAARYITMPSSAVWLLGIIVGVSYVGASLAWWVFLTVGVMSRFI